MGPSNPDQSGGSPGICLVCASSVHGWPAGFHCVGTALDCRPVAGLVSNDFPAGFAAEQPVARVSATSAFVVTDPGIASYRVFGSLVHSQLVPNGNTTCPADAAIVWHHRRCRIAAFANGRRLPLPAQADCSLRNTDGGLRHHSACHVQRPVLLVLSSPVHRDS